MDDFNHDHPEKEKNEIWAGNVSEAFYAKIGWNLKRLGETAYFVDGTKMPPQLQSCWFPVFLNRCELARNGFDPDEFETYEEDDEV